MSRKNIRLNTLIDELFLVQCPPLPPGVDKNEVKQTTIRPTAEVVHFYQYHAERLGISMQEMLMLSLQAVAHGSMRATEQTFQLVIDRFKMLFEAHRVPQIHAKSVIDASGEIVFPIGALTNDQMLLENFTPGLKESLQRVFHVRGAWLDGEEDNAVLADPIYSRDHAFSVWEAACQPWSLKGIELLSKEMLFIRSNRQLSVMVEEGARAPALPELLIYIVRNIKLDRHMEFKTYELTGIYPTSNKEARACVTALLNVGTAAESRVTCRGISVGHDDFSAMKSGRLPALCLNKGFPTAWDISSLPVGQDDVGAETLTDLLRISM